MDLFLLDPEIQAALHAQVWLLVSEDWMLFMNSVQSFSRADMLLPLCKSCLKIKTNALNCNIQCQGLWCHLNTSALRLDDCWVASSPSHTCSWIYHLPIVHQPWCSWPWMLFYSSSIAHCNFFQNPPAHTGFKKGKSLSHLLELWNSPSQRSIALLSK